MVCSFSKPSNDLIHFEVLNIAGRTSNDCSLFTIACTTECVWFGPSSMLLGCSEMRQHLISCLEHGCMICFPTLRSHCVPLNMRVKKSEVEKELLCLQITQLKCHDLQANDIIPQLQVIFHMNYVPVDLEVYRKVNWLCSCCQTF